MFTKVKSRILWQSDLDCFPTGIPNNRPFQKHHCAIRWLTCHSIPKNKTFLVSFFFIFDFYNDSKQLFYIKIIPKDCIRSLDLVFWNRPLCQLSHNHCPSRPLVFLGWARGVKVAELNKWSLRCLNPAIGNFLKHFLLSTVWNTEIIKRPLMAHFEPKFEQSQSDWCISLIFQTISDFSWIILAPNWSLYSLYG